MHDESISAFFNEDSVADIVARIHQISDNTKANPYYISDGSVEYYKVADEEPRRK